MKTKEEVLQEFRIQAIREAAGRVVAEKGIDGATMDAIAEAAGIAKGTIYLYFKNREDLLEKTADFGFEILVREVEEALLHPAPFREQLRTLARKTIEFFEAHRDFLRLYRSVHEEQGRCDERHRHPIYQRYLGHLTDWITSSAARGDVVSGDPQRIAAVISEAIHAILLLRLYREERPSAEEEASWLAALLLDGIALQGDSH